MLAQGGGGGGGGGGVGVILLSALWKRRRKTVDGLALSSPWAVSTGDSSWATSRAAGRTVTGAAALRRAEVARNSGREEGIVHATCNGRTSQSLLIPEPHPTNRRCAEESTRTQANSKQLYNEKAISGPTARASAQSYHCRDTPRLGKRGNESPFPGESFAQNSPGGRRVRAEECSECHAKAAVSDSQNRIRLPL